MNDGIAIEEVDGGHDAIPELGVIADNIVNIGRSMEKNPSSRRLNLSHLGPAAHPGGLYFAATN